MEILSYASYRINSDLSLSGIWRTTTKRKTIIGKKKKNHKQKLNKTVILSRYAFFPRSAFSKLCFCLMWSCQKCVYTTRTQNELAKYAITLKNKKKEKACIKTKKPSIEKKNVIDINW